jgi:hypothetical protein
MTLTEELFRLIRAFERDSIDYAVCGGLAMALHGYARTTQDIDVMMLAENIDRAKAVARESGFEIDAGRMDFGGGKTCIYRLAKIDPEYEDALPLDIIMVTKNNQNVWDNRIPIETRLGPIWSVTKAGLIQMKKLSGRKQDMADIERLEESDG